jgi:hypothetical protein
VTPTARADLHAPFRCRRGRVVAWVAAVGLFTAMAVSAAVLPWHGEHAIGVPDRLGFLVVGGLGASFLARCAQLTAVPSEEGLVVRNLLLTRRLEWAEVRAIRFGGGDPWVTLDLSDGDTLAVMAIQRADGARGRAEATRLATLIALHTSRD